MMTDERFMDAIKRVDDKDIVLSPTEVFSLQNMFVPSPADREPVPESSIDDIDPDLLGALMAARSKSRALKGIAGPEEGYRRLNVIDSEGRARFAGLMVLGKYPQQFFPKLHIDVAVHPGVRKSEFSECRFLDRVICEGPLHEMVEEAVNAVARNLRTVSRVKGTGRIDCLEIPEEVLREVFANAVLHRDYDTRFKGEAIVADIYSNRVVISNPGALWGGKTLQNLGDGSSQCRNTVLMQLANAFSGANGPGAIAEGQGSGIPMIIRAMREHGLSEPRFKVGFDRFSVEFVRIAAPDTAYALLGGEELGGLAFDGGSDSLVDARRMSAADAVLAHLEKAGTASAKDIAAASGKSMPAVRAALHKLVEDGRVVPTAQKTSRNRRYYLAG